MPQTSSSVLGGRAAEVVASSRALGREMGQAVTRRLGAGARGAPRKAMDSQTPCAQDAPAAPMSIAAPAGRKPKAKAPLPPAEIKYMDASSVENSVESASFIMEQKENMIDKDIELLVVLPGDIIKSTTVHGSKPMMDLLIFLCAQYHLNPSSYTIDLLSAEKNHIKFKPNTPIGMLEVEKVILKPKVLDKKKPTPIIPEKTVRVVINFKKTQKAIVRVSPHAPLQELAPIICSKCEFDPQHTLLMKDYQSQEPLDLTKSLNDLGLRELYAMDVSRATSVTAFNKSSLQESCQISQNLDIMKEKENKGFFSFFQHSKKKREQTASAPATPLINKHRPNFTRSNTISKPYVSNTLPSDAPKKRRAPLPPMPSSQSVPQDLAHIQERPASCVVKSTSVDETDKSPCEAGIVRTGSLQLSSTSIGNSSLRRMKRKAPSPPSKTAQHPSDRNGQVTALQSVDGVSPDSALETSSPEGPSSPEAYLGPGILSHEQSTAPKLTDETSLSEGPGTPEAAVASLTSGISSDYSLEEIEEKEELNEGPKDEVENISLKSPDIPFVSTDITNTLKKDSDSALGISSRETSQNSKEENQETRNTDGPGSHSTVYDTSNEDTIAGSVRNFKFKLGPSEENVQNESVVLTTNTEDNVKQREGRKEINVEGEAKNKDVVMEITRPSSYKAHETVSVTTSKENHLAAASVPDHKLNQPGAEKTKMQDAAIQTIPSSNSSEGNHQDHNLSAFRVDESMQTSNNKPTQHLSLSLQNSVATLRELRSQGTPVEYSEDRLAIKDPACAHGNDDPLCPVDEIDKYSAASYLKNFPLYRQDYNPKPKPSNEITREYIPKIGMTTYKIVPPKSLEILKDWESETIGYKDDQKIHALGKMHAHENVKEAALQTSDLVTSEGPKEPQLDLKPKPNLRTEHQLHRTVSSPDGAVTNPLKPPRMTRDAATAPFAPNLEDINNILESKFKSRVSNPQAKPSSFFLQMQKRVSGQYVTSAAAKNVHTVPNPAPKELTNKEMERDTLPPSEQTLSPLSKTVHPAPQTQIRKMDDDIISQKPAETSPPPVAPKPVPLPASQVAAVNLKTLKTFGAPRPYSSSAPSPFALAVVKRSQSFSKARPESPSVGASTQRPANIEDGKTCSVPRCADIPQLDVIDKNNSAHNGQNSQTPTPADCPSFTLKRQSSLTFQSCDPEQIRQSLLTAIRSGEAAAKLKRVTVPPNTISVNGRSGLSHSMSSDAQDGR
ncbi:cordon-bleu protein-like 1 isoform X2 [Sciurus carolinensis]|uniref:cordon-bleu protein-like 1 isoform X2 n=1 Tax=Sciurus carolinensis TaxID=30640 RepID=UPI001FB47DE2|nr:cordon-bleu protein-like 1 isoform X2 [Sciurus carolinensis]